ncbi:MAG: hypothetical protein ACLPN5_20780 [Roseiarcus sp.]
MSSYSPLHGERGAVQWRCAVTCKRRPKFWATRLIEFGRFAAANRERRGLNKPETFTFLGFTFICGTSRKGDFQIRRKTRADRMRAKLEEVKEALRERMHQSIPAQGKWLAQVIGGYYNYSAVPTNSHALAAFRYHIIALWENGDT